MAKKITFEGEKPTNVEELLESLGGFGRFQGLVLFLLQFMEIPCAFLVFVPVFIGVNPSEWMCNDAIVSRDEACSCAGNVTALDPLGSVVTEWDLICEKAWVSDTVISLQMSGMLVGNLYISQLSDWYGRRYCFLGIVLQMAVGSLLTAAAPNPYVYAFARFICGCSFAGFLTLTAVYAMEFLTPKWRPVASATSPFGEATMLLGVIAYFIRPWRTLVWATCIPFILIFIIFPKFGLQKRVRFVPESPRWLLRNNKIEEADKVFRRMAKINGRPPIAIEILREIAEKERPPKPVDSDEEVKVQRFSYLQFFRDRNLRKTTLCLQGIWFTWGLVYFGISYNIKNLPGSPYLNVVFMGLSDSIAYPTSFFVNNYFGRRKALVAFMTFTATFLVTMAILLLTLSSPEASLLAALCFIAKYGTAGARSAARTLNGESFPTAIRVMGIGIAGSTASIGGALAPQLAFLGTYWPSIPFFTFAGISVGGSMVSFLLAETNGKPLEEELNTKDKRISNIEIIANLAKEAAIPVEDGK